MATLDEADAFQRLVAVDTVFRPGAPIDREDLFQGRGPQRWSVMEAIRSPGMHAVIFGERGVGKTSLAKICIALGLMDGYVALRVPCDSGDDFPSLWKKFVDECGIYLADNPDSETELAHPMERAAEVLSFDNFGPGQVRLALRHIARLRPVVIYFDEFDQVLDDDALHLMSNTIKLLSDQTEPVTIIPVGVSESVNGLIVGHASISRILSQVRMPRMSRVELMGIAQRGFNQLEMESDADALEFISTVPRGLPQYAHLLAQEGARHALTQCQSTVTIAHLLEGLRVGLGKADHTLATAYDEATYSARPARFKEVLLACAIADPDEHGWLAPADLRTPYSYILGESVDIPRFNPQLVQLAKERGCILSRTGEEWKWRYRFSDPMMGPYVMLRGLDAGMITPGDVLNRFPSTPIADPNEPPQLFGR